MIISISNQPFIIHKEGNRAFANNGAVIYGFSVDLPEVNTLGEMDFDKIHSIWYNAFKCLRPGCIAHKMDIYNKEQFSTSHFPDQTYLQKVTKRHFQNCSFIRHTCFLFLSFRNTAWTNSGIINPFKYVISTKDLLESTSADDQFANEVDVFQEVINSSKLIGINPIDPSDFHSLESLYFNGFYRDRYTDIDTRAMRVGERHIGVMALSDVKQLSDTIKNIVVDQDKSIGDSVFYRGLTDSFGLELGFDHIVNQMIFLYDHKAEQAELQSKQRELYGARKFEKDYEHKAKKIDEYLDTLAEDERIRLVGTHFNVIFFADDKNEYKQFEGRLASTFRNIDITPYQPNGKNKQNLFFNSFLANVGNIDDENIIRPIDIQQALCLFTTTTNYKDDVKGIAFNDRVFNLPLIRDVWDEDKNRIKARNFFVMAPTGEGKSVLANHVLRQFYEDDVRVVIIDLGDSYRKLSLLYPEETVYIKYTEGQGLGLNPFFIESKSDMTPAKINELAIFIFKLWKRDRLPGEEEAVSLRKIIALYYNNVAEGHSFPNFYQFVESHKHDIMKLLELNKDFFDVDDFLHIGSEFVGSGMYAFLFDSNQDESFRIEGKKFIVFELDEVKDNATLLTIMLQLIVEAIQKVVWKDRSTRGVVFFDEFAKMLKFPNVLSTAEYFFQAARKQEAAIGIVLQSPSQLPKNEATAAIIDNTPVLYVLNNTKGYKDVVERFNLTQHDQVLLNSIRNNYTGKEKYSEVFLKIGSYSNVVRIVLPPEALLAYQTEGREYTEMMAIYQKTGDMYEAIEQYKRQHQ
jgi:conjugal transfer ATP-binding protein TraC